MEEILADWARKEYGFTSAAEYSVESDYGHNVTFSIKETATDGE